MSMPSVTLSMMFDPGGFLEERTSMESQSTFEPRQSLRRFGLPAGLDLHGIPMNPGDRRLFRGFGRDLRTVRPQQPRVFKTLNGGQADRTRRHN